MWYIFCDELFMQCHMCNHTWVLIVSSELTRVVALVDVFSFNGLTEIGFRRRYRISVDHLGARYSLKNRG